MLYNILKSLEKNDRKIFIIYKCAIHYKIFLKNNFLKVFFQINTDKYDNPKLIILAQERYILNFS